MIDPQHGHRWPSLVEHSGRQEDEPTTVGPYEELGPEELSEFVEVFRRKTLFGKLEEISEGIQALRERLDRLQPGGTLVPVQYLDGSQARLRRSFVVVVTASDGEYISQFVDCNINASGETEFEAVENLKDIVVATFLLLSAAPPERLGPIPTRQLAVLQQFLEMVT